MLIMHAPDIALGVPIVMNSLSSLIPVVGPIVAAAIAGTIAFVASVLAKENKTSEFRQAWIEGLRSDVAELLGEFNTLEISLGIASDGCETHGETVFKKHKFMLENRKDYGKVDALCNRVVLRLNPVEHKDLITKLRELEDSLGKGSDHSHALCVDLVDNFALLLKSEWARVKSGEPVFQKMKYVAVLVTALSAIAGVVLAAVAVLQS